MYVAYIVNYQDILRWYTISTQGTHMNWNGGRVVTYEKLRGCRGALHRIHEKSKMRDIMYETMIRTQLIQYTDDGWRY